MNISSQTSSCSDPLRENKVRTDKEQYVVFSPLSIGCFLSVTNIGKLGHVHAPKRKNPIDFGDAVTFPPLFTLVMSVSPDPTAAETIKLAHTLTSPTGGKCGSYLAAFRPNCVHPNTDYPVLSSIHWWS